MRKHNFFIILAVVLIVGGLYSRNQNAKMTRQKLAAIAVLDKASSDTTSSRLDLQYYAAAHMGAGASLTLQDSYQRAALAATAINANAGGAAAAAIGANKKVYIDAQATCNGHSNSIVQAHCNQAYLSSHLLPVPPVAGAVPLPLVAAYVYHYPAPVWSPDLAGALLLGGGLSLIVGFIGLISATSAGLSRS